MSGVSGVQYNGQGAFSTQSNVGSIAQWVAFAILTVSATFFFTLSYIRNVRPEARLTYYLVTLLCSITALSYLIQALGALGNTNTNTAWPGNAAALNTATSAQFTHNLFRTFMWLRYAAWAASIPLTVVVVGILAGAHWTELVWVSLSGLTSLAGLYAAVISTAPNATWPLFALAVVAGLPVAIALVYTFRISAHKVHPEIGRLYDVIGFGLLFLFFGYAITCAVSELGYVTTVDQEVIIYAVHDILTKAVFGFVLIWSRESIARYGTFLGQINTGVDFDFPIQRSTYTGSGSNYATEPTQGVAYGEHRDLAFAQLHAATNTQKTQGKELAYNPWP